MQVQVNTDDNVQGREELARAVEEEVERVLGRFEDHLTRVEVHLSDTNAAKGGVADKRCMMEARPRGQQPVAVTHEAATLGEAIGGAAKKLRSRLEGLLGRLHEAKGAPSIRDNEQR